MPPSANRKLQETLLQEMKNPLTPLIFLIWQHNPRIQSEMKYQVLQFLLDCPQFNRNAYKDINSPLLLWPPPVRCLPSGPESITIQFLPGTVNIPEASYEDNSKLIDEWFAQLQLNSPDMRERLGMNKLLVWLVLQGLVRRTGMRLRTGPDCNWLKRTNGRGPPNFFRERPEKTAVLRLVQDSFWTKVRW